MKVDERALLIVMKFFNSLCISFRLIFPFLSASRVEGSCMHSYPWFIGSSGWSFVRLFHGCKHGFKIDLSLYLLNFKKIVYQVVKIADFLNLVWLPKLEHTFGWLERSVSLYMNSMLFKHFTWFQLNKGY